jgi:hypothetical protein
MAAVGCQPENATAECTCHYRNTISPPISTNTGIASQWSDLLLPQTTQPGRQRRRMKWIDEINIFIMRAYYRITKLETDFTAYRDQLYIELMEKYPKTNVTAQQISDQHRVIVCNNLLPNTGTNKILSCTQLKHRQ